MESSPGANVGAALRGSRYGRPMVVLLLAACVDPTPEPAPFTVSVTVAEAQPTVLHVTWESEEPGVGWVTVGRDDVDEQLTTHRDAAPTTHHDILVAGLLPRTVWRVQAHLDVDGDVADSTEVPAKTGSLERGGIVVGSVEGKMESARWLMQGVLGKGGGFVMFDQDGALVWSYVHDFPRLTTRARLTPDGTTVLTGDFDVDEGGPNYGWIRRMSLDGTELDPVPTPGAHHDFAPTPDGYAYLALDVRPVQDHAVVGDQILEVDAEGNLLRTVWSSFDTWSADGATQPEPFYHQGLDWTHSNTLDYDAERDQLVVSVRNLSAILRIDRATGEVAEQIGGPTSDYPTVSGTPFEAQHSPFFVSDDEMLVMDNTFKGVSAVRDYRLDASAGTLTELGSIVSPSGANVSALGDVAHDEDGRTLTSWGTAGSIEEVDADGVPTFRLDLDLGSAFSFFDPVDQLGGPSPD